ncbi:MAG: hypothetical protein ACK5X3_03105, partial [Pseudomonadota bacterium]|jgi:hypothetical protein
MWIRGSAAPRPGPEAASVAGARLGRGQPAGGGRHRRDPASERPHEAATAVERVHPGHRHREAKLLPGSKRKVGGYGQVPFITTQTASGRHG